MRGLRWLLAGLILLIVVAVAGVWLLPSMLDWNRYRATIAELASERIGLPVRIDGPISLTLLPHPTLTAGRVSLRGASGTATAAQLRLQVALGALLRGRIDARDLVLRRLDVTLPWAPTTGPGLLAKAAPDWLSHVSARVEDGRLAIGGFVLNDIDATLATSEATGSYMLAGTARSGVTPADNGGPGAGKGNAGKAGAGSAAGANAGDGQGWHFTARLSRPGGDGAVGLDLAVDGLGKLVGLGGSLSGQIGSDGTLTGRVAVRGPDLSRLMPAPAVPFHAKGRVNIADGLAVADQLSGEVGGAATTGAVALRLDPRPRLDVAMSTSRLDLDAWAPALLRAETGGAQAFGGQSGLPIGIDLSAEAASLGGGTLRRLRGAFDIADGTVVVREARAVLPGDATFRLTGRLLPAKSQGEAGGGGGIRLDGTASVVAPSLRTTLAWSGASEGDDGLPAHSPSGLPVQVQSGLPPGALRSARLSGHVIADADGVVVERMTGVLDGGPVKGTLALRLGKQPRLRADLSVGRLDLGPWLPAALPSPSGVLRRLALVAPGVRRLGPGLALEVKLRASRALLHGVALAPLSFDVEVGSGRLAVHGAQFGLGGMRGSLSGTLLEDGRLADGRLALQAAHATALAALLPGLLPGFTADLRGPVAPVLAGLMRAPIWLGPVKLKVEAEGAAAALGVRVAASLGDLRIDARPVLDLSGPAWHWQGPVTLRHPGAPRLAVALGLHTAPDWLGDGSLSLVAQVAAGAGQVGLQDFTLTAGGLHAIGELALRLDAPGGPALTGEVSADQLPLPAPGADDPLPVGALAGWQANVRLQAARVLAGNAVVLRKAAGTLALSDGTLRLEGVTGQVAGGALALRASLDSNAAPPLLAAQGTLTGAQLTGPLLNQPFDLTAGTMDAKVTLASQGFSPDGLLAGMTGGLGLTVRTGALTGIDLPAAVAALSAAGAPGEPALRKALAGGSMGFDTLDVEAELAQGVVHLKRARLHAPSGGIDITGAMSLPDSGLDLRLQLRPKLPQAGKQALAVPPPKIGLRITGTPAHPLRAPELADVIRWRAARGR